MSDFREELIEAMARGVFDSETVGPLDALVDEQPIRDIVTVALDAALAFRQTVECPECGGTGEVFCADDDVFPDACGCIDGRVPTETRLAIVEVVGSNVPGTVICRFLAPDLPEPDPDLSDADWRRA